MSPDSYLDFDILIESSGGSYRAAVLNSPAGQASNTFSLPFSEKDLEILVLQVFRLTSRRSVRAVGAPEMTDVRAFGGRLFETLFAGPVSTCLLRSMDEADRTQRGLRLRLRLGNAPHLANIPWEFLYDGSSHGFLCLSDETPVVRYVDLPQRVEPLAAKAPLNMLCLISSPAGYPPLDVESEWRKLDEALGATVREGRLVMERMETPTLQALQRRLRRGTYHILHFVGHGAFDERGQDGILLLEDLEGKGHPVSGESLGVLLHDHESLRLVVLNACEGARTSPADPFAGTAQSLVRKGIPAVIAMQFEISDVAAITLASEFYSAIADGLPVDGALSEARKAIFTQVNAVEWATPVLYMRSPDGRIFQLEDQDERLETREMRRIRPELEPEPIVEPAPITPLPSPEPEPIVEPAPITPLPSPEPEPIVEPAWTDRVIRAIPFITVGLLLVGVAFFLVRWLSGGGGGSSLPIEKSALVQIPDVAHLQVAEAQSRLTALGFTVRRNDRPSRTVPKDLVISTTPPANRKAKKERAVTIQVSTGAWIAFASKEETPNGSTCKPCNWDIYVMPPDGGDPIDITSNPAFDGAPAWSPDGSKIAFVSTRDDPNPTACAPACNYEIYVMNPDGSAIRRLTDAPYRDGSPTWSPDGKRIAFHSNRNDPAPQTCDNPDMCNFNIFVMNADGKGLKRLTQSQASDSSPRWSPAGNRIAFNTNRDGNPEIYTIDLGTRKTVNVTHDLRADASPAWSPDGEKIAFRRIDNFGNFDIWITSADGLGDPVRFNDDSVRQRQPIWSPDGSRIAFLMGPPDDGVIAAKRADGTGAVQTLTPNDGSYDQLTW